jgi:hypothetical protein
MHRALTRPYAALEEMVWLTPERARVYACAALIAVVGAVAVELWSHGGYNQDGSPFGGDFGPFWAASRLVRTGVAAGPYDAQVLRLAEQAVYPQGGYEPFRYPPVFLALCLPFAFLPFFWGLAAFMGVTGAAYTAAIYQAGRSRWIVVAALAYPAVLVNLILGQNGMLTASILGGGLTLLDRRPRLSGLILGLMVIKPQLALGVPIALLLSRRWTVIGFAGISACALLGLTTLLLGWPIWGAFLDSTESSRGWLEQGSADPGNEFQSMFAQLRILGVSVPLSYVIQALCAGAGACLLYWAAKRRVAAAVERSLIVLVSLLAATYLWPYDLVVFGFPLLWLLVEWSQNGFPPWGKLVLLVLYVLPLSSVLTFSPHHLCLFGIIGLMVYLWWAGQRGKPWRAARVLSRVTPPG